MSVGSEFKRRVYKSRIYFTVLPLLTCHGNIYKELTLETKVRWPTPFSGCGTIAFRKFQAAYSEHLPIAKCGHSIFEGYILLYIMRT